jgi:hypothetical protein
MFDLEKLDRRWIYLFMLIIISMPIIYNYSIEPIQLKSADKLYDFIEKYDVSSGKVAFLAYDFGANTIAENGAQASSITEHLLRRRIPFVVFSQYQLSVGFLNTIPEKIIKRLEAENPNEKYVYGKDWINVGFRPGGSLFIQGIAKAENLAEFFKTDANGSSLTEFPIFQKLESIKDIGLVGQITGLTGTFDSYVQFFKTNEYAPPFVHGCTAITIPEAYIYLDSGQLQGLFEGIAGAAWYSQRLLNDNPNKKPDDALVINTALGIAHIAIIFLIIAGNLNSIVRRK